MPIEHIKYTCQFKCGMKAKEPLSAVIAHEYLCWNNPDNRTCRTCKHEVYENDGCDHPELPGCPSEKWKNRSCKIPQGDAEIEFQYDNLKIDDMHIKPLTNCPFWEKK